MSMYKNSKFKLMYGSNKVKALMFGSAKAWSGASVVSYYDGSRLMGTAEVDEGEDVLHPSISTSKSGYTLVGWSTSRYGSKITSLVATGEPMTVYAVYLPNTVTILSASFTNEGVNPVYTIDSYNSAYISNPTYAQATGWYGNNYSTSDTQSMYVYMGDYRTMTVKAKGSGFGGNLVAKFMDENCLDTILTKTYYYSRYLTMYASGSHSDSGSWHLVRCGCTSIVLSNPRPWT